MIVIINGKLLTPIIVGDMFLCFHLLIKTDNIVFVRDTKGTMP